MEKELQGCKEGPKVKIHVDSRRETLKKIPNSETPNHDSIHGYCFKRLFSIHDRLAIEINKCFEETDIPEWMT